MVPPMFIFLEKLPIYMVDYKVALFGFLFTGNWPYNSNVFTKLDFASFNVTDRAVIHDPSADPLKVAIQVSSKEPVEGHVIMQSIASIF